MKIYCTKCKRWIGEVYEVGGLPTIKEPSKLLLSVRVRQDGEMGFQCECGNYSIVAEAEKGILPDNGKPPTEEGVMDIKKKLEQGIKSQPVETSFGREVDGFAIKEA